jgi:hypothetical protein
MRYGKRTTAHENSIFRGEIIMRKRYHCFLEIFVLLILCVIGGLSQAKAEEFKLPDMASGKVVLSWTELKTLLEELERSKAKAGEKPKEEILPVEYAIVEAQFNGSVEEKSARFEANCSVQVLKDGWVMIPFFSGNIGIEAAKIDVQEAQFVKDTDGYRLIARGPGILSICVTFRVPVQIDNLLHTLSFKTPRAVINRVRLRIPGKGVTIVQADPRAQITQAEDAMIFQTVLGESDELKVSWSIEKEDGVSRKSSAQVLSLVSVEKAALSVFSTVVLKNLVALDQVQFQIPADVEILDVKSPEIERWSAEQAGETQIITMTGQNDRHAAIEIALSYRRRIPALPVQAPVPMVDVSGVDDLEGFLGVEVLDNLEVTSGEAQNGVSVPAKNLPKALWQKASSPLLYGYEYHVHTFNTSLSLKSYQEIQTVVANVDMVDCVTHRTLEGKSITRVKYFIRNNDRQFLTLKLPGQSRIWQAFLDGTPVKPAQKETGEILIPMKKSSTQGEALQSFSIEIGYITEVGKLSLKGDLLNELPGVDLPINYLRWSLYLPEYYEYSGFEGPLKQVEQWSNANAGIFSPTTQIDIPTQGKLFRFEKYLIVDETPYMKGKYGQYLGDDIFLTLQPRNIQLSSESEATSGTYKQQFEQIAPNRFSK